MNYNLIAYALDFTSFLIQSLGSKSLKIEKVILFGSVARGEEGKKSDLDIFVETEDSSLVREIPAIRDNFYQSVKAKKYWGLLGIKREINCSVGSFKEWGELERSLAANSLVLYAKYSGKKEDVQSYYLVKVEAGKERGKNVLLWRKLYGYTQKIGKKTYVFKGLVGEAEGKKLAPSIFILPIEKSSPLINFLRKNRVKHELNLIWK